MYFDAAIFRQLTTIQLQELCRRNDLSALGRRTTLENISPGREPRYTWRCRHFRHTRTTTALTSFTESRTHRWVPNINSMPSWSTVFGDSGMLENVKEIQSGEFSYLSKLLPKNLSLHDEEDNLSLSLENSVIKVSKKTKASTSITDIEQWTNAFTTYLSVFIDKFPLRSQELLQYLSLIRYAARVHKGLGWVIYDYKFRQKASKNKSLLWSTIDSQLWLTIFTVHPGVLREEYPLFTKGPSTGSSSSANSKGSYRSGTCNIYNRSGSRTRDTCWYEHICSPRSTLISFEQYFTSPFQSLGLQA